MFRVFISSTYEDLIDFREKVRVALKQKGYEDITLEHLFVKDESKVDDWLEYITNCDLYLGIFAWKYGIPYNEDTKSIIELEYEKAVEKQKDRIIFLLDENSPWPAKFVDKDDNILDFRRKLSQTSIVNFFKSTEDFTSKVYFALQNWEIKKASLKKNSNETLQSQNQNNWEKKRDDYIKELRDSYKKNNLVLFLGAGVSKSAKMPDWQSLLSRLMVSVIEEEFPSELDLSEHEKKRISEKLQKIHEGSPLVEARYINTSSRDKLEEKVAKVIYEGIDFDDKRGTSPLLKAISRLCIPQRTGPPVRCVVTYNFDDLLERHLEDSVKYNPVYKDVYYVSPEELAIFHVHGFLPREAEKRKESKSLFVFSEEGYHDLYSQSYFWSNIVQLNCFRENNCLMIGLSVTDPNLRRLLDIGIKSNNNNKKHYVLFKRLLRSDLLGKDTVNGYGFVKQFFETHNHFREKSSQEFEKYLYSELLNDGEGKTKLNDELIKQVLSIYHRFQEKSSQEFEKYWSDSLSRDLTANNDLREEVIDQFLLTHHRLQEESFQKLGLNIIWYKDHDEIPNILEQIRN